MMVTRMTATDVAGGAPDQVRLAREIAERAHSGQVDRGGNPYIDHLAWVAGHVEGDVAKAAAWLQDVLEDTETVPQDLRDLGVSDRVVEVVEELTRAGDDSYLEYVRSLRRDPVAVQVKLADLKHNCDLSRIPSPTRDDMKRVERYRKAIEILEDPVSVVYVVREDNDEANPEDWWDWNAGVFADEAAAERALARAGFELVGRNGKTELGSSRCRVVSDWHMEYGEYLQRHAEVQEWRVL